jgi:SET domain-containing protein
VNSSKRAAPPVKQKRHGPGVSPQLEIRTTSHKGRGVFALSFIAAGTKIVACGGHKCRTQDLPPESFALQIDDDWWLYSDGTLLDDCINHSCEPNIGFAGHEPVLYALRDIMPEEELSWDYSTSINCEGWSLDCHCQSKGCRGVILPFHALTLEQQLQLRPFALKYLHQHVGARGE